MNEELTIVKMKPSEVVHDLELAAYAIEDGDPELLMRVRGAIKRIVTAVSVDAATPPAAVAVPEGVLRRVDSIILDCDMSGGRQTGGYLSASDLRKVRDAIAAAPATPAATGWQPIETAPKDNAERILLCKDCGPGSLQSYSVGFFINGWHGAECRGMQTLADIGYRVTHWMPLPDYPPAPAATKKEEGHE